MSQTQSPTGVRRHARVRTQLRVRYGTLGLDRADFAETLSAGGLYIRTNEIFKVGTRLMLEIAFPERAVCRRGEVVWAIQAPEHLQHQMVVGMGIAFLDEDPQWSEFFDRWRQAHAAV